MECISCGTGKTKSHYSARLLDYRPVSSLDDKDWFDSDIKCFCGGECRQSSEYVSPNGTRCVEVNCLSKLHLDGRFVFVRSLEDDDEPEVFDFEKGYERLWKLGQLARGHELLITVAGTGGKRKAYTVEEVECAGTEDEKVILDAENNLYFMTDIVINRLSWTVETYPWALDVVITNL